MAIHLPTTGNSSSGGGPGATLVAGQGTVTFTNNVSSVTLVVADTGVTATSRIFANIATAARDADELELSPLLVGVGAVSVGVGYTLIVVAPQGDADGDFTVNYLRVD